MAQELKVPLQVAAIFIAVLNEPNQRRKKNEKNENDNSSANNSTHDDDDCRSRLAKGTEINGNIGTAPQAANMLKMKYDCNAEASAMAAAKKCSGKPSPPETRPGYKENFVKIHRTFLNLPDTARHASQIWWKQLAQYGANRQMLFTQAMRTEKTRIIRNWGKSGRVYLLRSNKALGTDDSYDQQIASVTLLSFTLKK
ncbi:SCP-like protein [Ancylostoma duodenale]|uniref:SCP-like protein n=1 Tax=Ancylostoma duodenale TaxID=51022 RepID=A0A0C2G9E2_9BILA|nr:SCP-like protein [Ancylostoma duodenale]